MSGFELNVSHQGVDQMLRELAQLERRLQTRAVRAGLVEFVQPIKKAAQQLAPKDSGDLARAVSHRNLSPRVKRRLGIAAGTVSLLVGPNRKVKGRWQTKKGIWQEHGTKRMQASPFLGPALERGQAGGEQRFYKGLSESLERMR
ncbi:HK97-gp10 family putative phage morphogenesis protein [Oceanimonas smirnovii]|uniref:HK97-gp10 family putative phage morphogenesis protein n=1 Tax=Oceanimonas smirnovii TaxID=264574 RepID=UPI003FD215CE